MKLGRHGAPKGQAGLVLAGGQDVNSVSWLKGNENKIASPRLAAGEFESRPGIVHWDQIKPNVGRSPSNPRARRRTHPIRSTCTYTYCTSLLYAWASATLPCSTCPRGGRAALETRSVLPTMMLRSVYEWGSDAARKPHPTILPFSLAPEKKHHRTYHVHTQSRHQLTWSSRQACRSALIQLDLPIDIAVVINPRAGSARKACRVRAGVELRHQVPLRGPQPGLGVPHHG